MTKPNTYRKLPVEIQAIQFTGANAPEVEAFFGPDAEHVEILSDRVMIPTLEGLMRADIGSWIIRGVKGEYYPCKDEIFRTTYIAATAPIEEVDTAPPSDLVEAFSVSFGEGTNPCICLTHKEVSEAIYGIDELSVGETVKITCIRISQAKLDTMAEWEGP